MKPSRTRPPGRGTSWKGAVKLQQKLEVSEKQLVEYGLEHNILLPTENNNVIMEKLKDLNQEMTKVETEVLSNQYHAMRDTTLDSFPEKLKTSVMKDLDSRRSELEQKLAIASQRFGPKWPEVLTLKQELADVRQQLANEQRKVLEQAKAEYNLAVAHRDRLAAALTTQNSLANRLTQDSIQFNSLKREVETDRQLHEGLLQRLKETDISAGLKSANVHVINRGHVPTLPSSPNVPRNLALGLISASWPASCWLSPSSISTGPSRRPEDVERDLRLPFLGAIPAFENSWKAGERRSLDADRQRAGEGRAAAHLNFGRRGILGKLSRAQDFPAVFFAGRAAAQHPGDVRPAWRGQEHHGREPGDCPGADGGAHASFSSWICGGPSSPTSFSSPESTA